MIEMRLMYAHETIAEVTDMTYRPGREPALIYTLPGVDPRIGTLWGTFKTTSKLDINPNRRYKIICDECVDGVKTTIRFAQVEIFETAAWATLEPGEYAFGCKSYMEITEPVNYKAFRRVLERRLTNGQTLEALRDQHESGEGSGHTIDM